MATWPAKDPDATLDYEFIIALDEGDTVDGTPDFDRLSGTVEIVGQSFSPTIVSTEKVARGQKLTVELEGGEAGEISVFRVSWETVGGRIDDDVITLAVISHEFPALLLTGYAKPFPPHLVARYSAFAGVDPGVIQYWLTDAERYVSDAWTEGDYAAALMALAAHNMTLAGYGTDAGPAELASIPAGTTRFRSGSFEMQFTEQAANARTGGDLDSTRYGLEYAALLARNRGGPLVTPTGTMPPGYFPSAWPS